MKCPLTAKCQSKLTAEVQDAERKTEELADNAQEQIGELQEELALLKFRHNALKEVAVENITDKGKKKLSGYYCVPVGLPKPTHPCRKCGSVEKRINRSDMKMTYCSRFDHRVDARAGSCHHHSSISAGEQSNARR